MASTEPRTLLLYCPFEKKVTRHSRRGPGQQMLCLDCGRGVEPKAGAAGVRPREGSPRDPRHEPRREAQMKAAPVPDLAEILAAAAEPPRPPAWARKSSSSRTVPLDPPPTAREPARRVKPASVPADSRLHPALVIAAAFFAVLALANVVSNWFREPAVEPPVAVEAILITGTIVNTEGLGVYLRRSANFEDRLPTALPEGTPIRVLGQEAVVEGVPWRQVEDMSGLRGWVPTRYVRLT